MEGQQVFEEKEIEDYDSYVQIGNNDLKTRWKIMEDIGKIMDIRREKGWCCM